MEYQANKNCRTFLNDDSGNSIAMGILFFLLLLGFWFKLVLRWLCWYYIGCIGITLVVIPSLNVDGK